MAQWAKRGGPDSNKDGTRIKRVELQRKNTDLKSAYAGREKSEEWPDHNLQRI